MHTYVWEKIWVVVSFIYRQAKRKTYFHGICGVVFVCLPVNSFVQLSTLSVFCFIRDSHHGPGHHLPCTDDQNDLHRWLRLGHRHIICPEGDTFKHSVFFLRLWVQVLLIRVGIIKVNPRPTWFLFSFSLSLVSCERWPRCPPTCADYLTFEIRNHSNSCY